MADEQVTPLDDDGVARPRMAAFVATTFAWLAVLAGAGFAVVSAGRSAGDPGGAVAAGVVAGVAFVSAGLLFGMAAVLRWLAAYWVRRIW